MSEANAPDLAGGSPDRRKLVAVMYAYARLQSPDRIG